MMIRTQIQLTEAQLRRLRQAARAQGISVAEMIRRLVDRGVEHELPDRDALYARAAAWVGAFEELRGADDVSERHDAYLDSTFG